MIIPKNSSKVWDKIWEMHNCSMSIKECNYFLKREKNSIQWKRIKDKIMGKYGSFKKLKTIELGGGQSWYSLLFALEGADVTILDYSPKAIEASKLLFKVYGEKGKFLRKNALDLDKNLLSKFDVSMSFGTAEHFSGKNRIEFIRNHFKLLKKDGLVFINTPNKWCPQYRIWRFLSQSFGRWVFGEEYPFSISEYNKIGKIIGKDFEFFGGYLLQDPFLFKNRLKKLLGIRNKPKIKKEFGTHLDKYFSLILVAFSKN